MGRLDADIYLGLVHAPVYNKKREKIATTITNLDLHDISRAGRTYAVNSYYVITPLKSQQALARRMQNYWMSEFGAGYNANRKEAFSVLKIVSRLEEAIELITEETQKKPRLIATSARPSANNLSFKELRKIIDNTEEPFLIIFGTGWGLTEEMLQICDYILSPVFGRGDFNHLSVRSAASIILDRLLADPWW